jgi:hypothetical protein
MKLCAALLLLAAVLHPLLAQVEPELPAPGDEALDVEPPLLIPNRSIDEFLAVAAARKGETAAGAPLHADVEKLEKDLTRAKSRAAGAERLFRAGIISKVDAEDRQLRVVRLEAQLAEAQLAHAKQRAKEANAETVQIASNSNDAELAAAAEAAQRAAEERHRAELEAAERNLQRQQKLLSLGSGRRADVARAQQRLAELQQPESRQ